MKKMGMASSALVASMVGIGAYILLNKKTKDKADKLINNMLDKANECTNHMCK